MVVAYERVERAYAEHRKLTQDLSVAAMNHVRAVLGAQDEGDIVVEQVKYGKPCRFIVRHVKVQSKGSVYLSGPMVKVNGEMSQAVDKGAFLDYVILSDRSDRT